MERKDYIRMENQDLEIMAEKIKVSKLDLKAGDVLVFRFDEFRAFKHFISLSNEDQRRSMISSETLERLTGVPIGVLVFPPGINLEVLRLDSGTNLEAIQKTINVATVERIE